MLQNSPMYAYIPATDMARARKFYEGQLGFVAKEETNGGVGFETYDMPGPAGVACALLFERMAIPCHKT
jgi:predicted enzyme related to lactoylglutathione lyase